jgi:isopenicillin-N epimerase
VKVWTPLDDDRASCGIGLVQVDGIETGKLGEYLSKRNIVVVGMGHKRFEGIRVTPNVYTTPREIDVFAEAVEGAIKKGLLVEKAV